MAQAAVLRISGSQDIYGVLSRENASVNFITCHDGFTLYDLFSYNKKHNEKNGWNNTDGANDNNSWNCGAEGETRDPAVLALRYRLMRNAFAVLMCSRGIPMFLAGDEFFNTQFGNNNAYCQDNLTSWLDWRQLEEHQGMFRFFKYMIRFRKSHRVLRTNISNGALGFPDVSFYGTASRKERFEEYDHYVGILFAGQEAGQRPEVVYLASNAYWEELNAVLPALPRGMHWEVAADTWEEEQKPGRIVQNTLYLKARSVIVLVGKTG